MTDSWNIGPLCPGSRLLLGGARYPEYAAHARLVARVGDRTCDTGHRRAQLDGDESEDLHSLILV